MIFAPVADTRLDGVGNLAGIDEYKRLREEADKLRIQAQQKAWRAQFVDWV